MPPPPALAQAKPDARLAVRPLRIQHGKRSIEVTPEGFRFLALVLLLTVAAVNTGNNLLYLILAMMLSLLVLSGMLSEQSLRRVTVVRRLPTRLFAGEETEVRTTVRNRKRWLSSFSLHVRSAGIASLQPVYFFKLRPEASLTRAVPCRFARRGVYRLPGPRIATRFPFGMFDKEILLPGEAEIVVYPAIGRLAEWPAAGAAFGRRDSGRKGSGTSFYALREYRSGDDSRAIHWKTSARQRRLLVQEQEQESDEHLTVILSTPEPDGPVENPDRRFEAAVELAATWLWHAWRRGLPIRLWTGGEAIGPGRGNALIHRMLRHLAAVSPTPRPSGFPAEALPGRSEIGVLILAWPDPIWHPYLGRFARIIKADPGARG